METIKNFKQYCDIADHTKSNFIEILTNNFLLPDVINQYITDGKLLWEQMHSGLFFYIDEKDYYSLYFIIRKNDAFCDKIIMESKTKPIILELLFREDRKNDIDKMEELFLTEGFEFYNLCRRLTLTFNNQSKDNIESLNNKQYCAVYAQKKDIQAIYALWNSNLDIYGAPLPTENEFYKLILNRQIFSIINNANQEICAATICKPVGKMSIIQSVAVLKKYRGQGLASKLISHCLVDAREKNVGKFISWVDEKNTHSLSLFKKFNFIEDEMLLKRFIRKNF